MPIYRRKNINFFKKWSREMAYVLGYFAADGNMIRNKRGAYYVAFDSTDRELIENVRRLVKTDLRISSRLRSSSCRQSYRIQIGSKEMFNDLLNFGVMPNKSKQLLFPDVPQEYFADFVRGFFDGDGHVSTGVYRRSKPRNNESIRVINSGFTCASEFFVIGLNYYLKNWGGIDGGSFSYSNGAYQLRYSMKDSRRLYDFMYTEIPKGLYLKRKKIKFEKFYLTNGPVA